MTMFENEVHRVLVQVQAETYQQAAAALELTHPDHRHQLGYDYADFAGYHDGVLTVTRTLTFWCELAR